MVGRWRCFFAWVWVARSVSCYSWAALVRVVAIRLVLWLLQTCNWACSMRMWVGLLEWPGLITGRSGGWSAVLLFIVAALVGRCEAEGRPIVVVIFVIVRKP